MKITNYQNPQVDSSCDFIKETIGIVVKSQTDTGTTNIGVYIPRLMLGLDITSGPSEQTFDIDFSIFQNSLQPKFGADTSVNWQNWISIPIHTMSNFRPAQYQMGDLVKVDFEDQDITSIFAVPYGPDDSNRRLQDFLSFYVSARPDDTAKVSEDNIYQFKLDAVNKQVKISTSKANGEVDIYTLTFDALNGKVYLGDSQRFFGIGSQDDIVEMKNSAGTSIELNKGKINIIASDVNYQISNSITINAKKLTETINNITRTVNGTLKEEIAKHTRSGNKRTDTTDSVVESGTSHSQNYSKDVVSSPTLNVDGLLGANEVAWGVQDGMGASPTAPNISSDGAANFANPAQVGKSVALSQPLLSVLSGLAAQIDTLFGILGVPPAASAQVEAASPLISSPYVKG